MADLTTPYTPTPIYFEDSDLLVYNMNDEPSVVRSMDVNFDLVIDMATRVPVGFQLHCASGVFPATDKILLARAEAAEQGAKLFALRSETFQRQLAAAVAKLLATERHAADDQIVSLKNAECAAKAEANLARAREILKPFADAANNADDGVPDDLKCEGHYPIHDASWEQVTLDHCRAASRFLTEGGSTAPSDRGGKG